MGVGFKHLSCFEDLLMTYLLPTENKTQSLCFSNARLGATTGSPCFYISKCSTEVFKHTLWKPFLSHQNTLIICTDKRGNSIIQASYSNSENYNITNLIFSPFIQKSLLKWHRIMQASFMLPSHPIFLNVSTTYKCFLSAFSLHACFPLSSCTLFSSVSLPFSDCGN